MPTCLTVCSSSGNQNTLELLDNDTQVAVLCPDTETVTVALKQTQTSSEEQATLFTLLSFDWIDFNDFLQHSLLSFKTESVLLQNIYNNIPENGIRIIPTSGKTITISENKYHIIAAISDTNKVLFEFIYNNTLKLVKVHVYPSPTDIPGVSNYIEINEGVLLRVHSKAGMLPLTTYNQDTYSLFNVNSLLHNTNPGLVVQANTLNNIMNFYTDRVATYIGIHPFIIDDGTISLIKPDNTIFTDNISKSLIFQNINPVTYIIKSGQCLYTADSETVYCLNVDGSIIWTTNAAWMADIGTITALSISTDMLIVTGTLGLAFFALNGVFLCRYSYNSITGEIGAYQNEVTSLL